MAKNGQVCTNPFRALWVRRLVVALALLVVVVAAGCAETGEQPPPGQPPGAKTPDTGTAAAGPVITQGQALDFKRLTLKDGLSQSSVNCIVQDAQGFMWFGTQDGLNRYDGYTFQTFRHDPDDPYSLAGNYILRCERDPQGAVWIVTQEGTLHRFDPGTGRFIRYVLNLEDPFQQAGNAWVDLHWDEQGRLWIATLGDGLIRYDPDQDSFVYYQHDPSDPASLGHRIVRRVYEDRDGTLWVGTEGGLNRYAPETDSFVRYPYRDFPPGGYQADPPVHTDDPAFQPDNPDALASPAVTDLLEDREGRLWVGTRYGGLNLLDREAGTFTSYPFDASYSPANPNTFSGNSVLGLLEDRTGQLWVSSADWNLDNTRTYARLGLEQLDPATSVITRHRANPEDPCSLPHDATLLMYQDVRGNLWFHTFAGGVEVYDRASSCFMHYEHDSADTRTLSSDDIALFYEDDAGGLWIGTMTGGLSHYDPARSKFQTLHVAARNAERMSNDLVWRMAASPGNIDENGHAYGIWVSTFAGLNYWDRQAPSFTFYEIDPAIPDVIAYAVFEDTERRTLWLGTTMGLERARLPVSLTSAPKALTFTRVLTRSNSSVGMVNALHPASEDQVWLAQYQMGLSRFDLATETILATYAHDPDDAASLIDDRITGIFPAVEDGLWIATLSGLDYFDPASGVFTHYLDAMNDPTDAVERILSVYQAEVKGVWVGTDGQGLKYVDLTTDSVTATYDEDEGLPNNVVYAILPDAAGGLWLSTNRGLARFDPEARSFQAYTTQDGLQSNEFNLGAAIRMPDEELLFGGVSGISAFYPEEIAPSPYVPPVVITNITLGPPGATDVRSPSGSGLEVDSAGASDTPGTVTLSYRDRILSFEFAALHYAIPERNQYAYRLEGFDPDWHYVGDRRFATYTNLPPDRYTFHVKGSNSDGVWNEQGAAVAVIVTPPFWATWWFRGLAGLLMVGAVFSAYRLRVRSVEARSRELERQVAERTEELAAVNAIAAVVSRSLNLEHVLADALNTTLDVMRVDAGGIYLLDRESGTLTIAAQRGLSAALTVSIDNLAPGEGFSGRVFQSGEPLVAQDIAEDLRLTRSQVRDEDLHSLLVAPLRAKSGILGTMFTLMRGYRTYAERDVQLLTAIGQQIGVAVENAGLYEDTRNRVAQLTALQETSLAAASTLELDSLLQLIIRQAAELLQADGGILNLVDWEAGEDRVVAATGTASTALGLGSRLDASLSGWASLHRQALVSNDLRDDARVDREGLIWLQEEQGRPVQSAAVALLTIKDQVVGTLVLVDKHKGQGHFDKGDLDLLQTFANQAVVAIENARLFEAEQRRAEQFRVISQVGGQIASILVIDELLDQMVRLIRDAFDYYHVAIGLVEGDEVVYRAGAGKLWNTPDFHFEPGRLKVGTEGVTGWVASSGEPLLIRDVSQDPRYVWMQQSETRSELAVPLTVKGTVIGVLDVQSDCLGAFDESDLLVLQSLAQQAAVAIENARLYEQARRVAVIEERQRLARELHDSVTQALYGATLYAEAAARQLDAGAVHSAAGHLRELRDTAQEALREMRLLIFELRPSVLDSEGLMTALRARLEAVEERAGLGVSFEVQGEVALPVNVEEGLYRIAREALNNALKHARAQHVSICLDCGSDRVVLQITDDGAGFDPAVAVACGGLGLEGMSERAAQMGGRLIVDSSPGTGTCIRVEVPL